MFPRTTVRFSFSLLLLIIGCRINRIDATDLILSSNSSSSSSSDGPLKPHHQRTHYDNSILSDPLDLTVHVGESASFDVYLRYAPSKTVSIALSCEGGNCSTFDQSLLPPNIELTPNQYRLTINISARKAGHDIIVFDPIGNDTLNFDTKNAFVRVRVARTKSLNILQAIFGWGYFVIWSLSFWPQNFTNYRKKSVIGLSLDYTILHFTGFIYYSIFNIGLYYSSEIQELYEEKYPRSEIPVELNDVVYSLHAAFTTSITFIQCFIYERGDQKLALYSKLFQGTVWSIGGILLIMVWLETVNWLTFIYYFSYVKLLVTSTKYLPQLWFNFRRKSTQGWTIYMVLLDVTGGSLSMLQMVTNAYNYDDWTQLVGNLPKFGLGLASVFYDILFMLQHFVLYRGQEPQNFDDDDDDDDFNKKKKQQQRRETLKSINEQNILCQTNSTSVLVDNYGGINDHLDGHDRKSSGGLTTKNPNKMKY